MFANFNILCKLQKRWYRNAVCNRAKLTSESRPMAQYCVDVYTSNVNHHAFASHFEREGCLVCKVLCNMATSRVHDEMKMWINIVPHLLR